MQQSVGNLAYYFSIFSFLLYVVQSLGDLLFRFKQEKKSPTLTGSPVGGSMSVPDILNAFAKLVDSLSKSSPSLLSLLASVVFLALALFSASSMFK